MKKFLALLLLVGTWNWELAPAHAALISQYPNLTSLQSGDLIIVERPGDTNYNADLRIVLGSAAFTASSAYDPIGAALNATNALGGAAFQPTNAFDLAGAWIAGTNALNPSTSPYLALHLTNELPVMPAVPAAGHSDYIFQNHDGSLGSNDVANVEVAGASLTRVATNGGTAFVPDIRTNSSSANLAATVDSDWQLFHDTYDPGDGAKDALTLSNAAVQSGSIFHVWPETVLENGMVVKSFLESDGPIIGDGHLITALDASHISSGIVPTVRLGSGGDGSGTHYLADDQTYKSIFSSRPSSNYLVQATNEFVWDLSAVQHLTLQFNTNLNRLKMTNIWALTNYDAQWDTWEDTNGTWVILTTNVDGGLLRKIGTPIWRGTNAGEYDTATVKLDGTGTNVLVRWETNALLGLMFTNNLFPPSDPMPAAAQSDLVFYARSDGVIQTNGFVTGMLDVHNAYNTVNPNGVTNNVLADSSLTTNAFLINDFQGNVAVEWPWQAIESAPRTSLEQLTNAGVTWSSTVNFTTFAVASFADYGNIIDIRSWGFPGLAVSSGRQLGCALTFNGNTPINKSVFIVSSGGSHIYTYINGKLTDNAATGATSATGITIGNNFAGYLYQAGVINRALTTNEMADLGAWLAGNANVRTNYADAVTAFGDSMTAGIGSTNLQSWPYQFYEARPDFLVYNLATSGAQIPTSSSNPGLDAFFDSSVSNRFIMQMGVNNMLNGDTASTIYTDLTNYLSARQVAHPNWYLLPVTLANTGSGTPSVITNYNNMIRAGTNSGIYTHISDPGWQSPVETRLDDASNPTYFFSDGLHLVNAGYQVQMQHATNAVLNGGR